MDPTFLQYLFAVKSYMREEYPDVVSDMDAGKVCTTPEMSEQLSSMLTEIIWDAFMNNAPVPMCAGGMSLAIKDFAARK